MNKGHAKAMLNKRFLVLINTDIGCRSNWMEAIKDTRINLLLSVLLYAFEVSDCLRGGVRYRMFEF